MSASLVGSEMCIRDRPRPIPKAAAGSGGRSRARPSLAEGRVQAGGAATVSYTHLTLPTICSV
eukprot:5689568-Alexandrium_andersonii.AAC.1